MEFKTSSQSEAELLIECLEIAKDYYQRQYDEAFAEGEEQKHLSCYEGMKNQIRLWINKVENTDTSSQDLSFNDLFPDLVSPQQELRAKIAVQVLPWHIGRIANEYEGEHRGKWDQEAARRAVRTADALIEELQKKNI